MTKTLTKISILDVIGTPIAVSTEKAQLVFDQLNERLSKEESVALSFAGVTNLVTAFLNTAVGQLFSKFTSDYIQNHLEPVDATPDQLETFKEVIDLSPLFFKEPEMFQEAYRSLPEHPNL
jgi:hypothetical protein